MSHSVETPFRTVLSAIRRHALGHAIVLVSVVLAVGCAIGSQYAVKHLVDVLSAGRAAATDAALLGAFALLAGLIAADNLLWRVGGWTASRVFVAVTGDLRRHLFAHLTGHAPSYFAERSPGTLAGRITATGNAVYTVLSTLSWNVLPPTAAVLGAIMVLGSVNLGMASALIILASLLSLTLVWLARRGRPLHQKYAEEAAAVDGELVDVIGNIGVVRAFGATMRERDRFAGRVEREMGARRRSLRYMEGLRLFHAVTTAALSAGLLGWGLLLWRRGEISTGDVVLITTMGFTILHGTRDLAVALVDCTQHVARMTEALRTLLVPHEMPDRPDARTLGSAAAPAGVPPGEVVFDDVCFAYPAEANGERRPVLDHFTLRVAPGERVGLVGRSGSGKSTALALLQRMRAVSSGTVLIDRQPIMALTDDSLREAMSVVPQDVMLFHRSVAENIRYGKPEATDEEVRVAAEAAGCDFIDLMPEGMATMVGDRGVRLSGGQRQRLAIARAFLRDAPILLLDEATSALDSESEQAVQQALSRLMTGRTVIAIAHRLSTLRDFDRIVVMDGGRILQDGAPAALEQSPGPFRDLLARQAFQVRELADATGG
jgi:ATP-binding cassette subfamily B protein